MGYILDPMTTSTFDVTGMTCEHCVRSVGGEVGAVPGVTGVDVDLATGRVRVTSEGDLDEAAVRDAVEEAGYEVTGP